MAVDSAEKRASLLRMHRPWMPVLPVPSGTVSQGERQHFLYLYAGVASGVITGGRIWSQHAPEAIAEDVTDGTGELGILALGGTGALAIGVALPAAISDSLADGVLEGLTVHVQLGASAGSRIAASRGIAMTATGYGSGVMQAALAQGAGRVGAGVGLSGTGETESDGEAQGWGVSEREWAAILDADDALLGLL